MRTSQHATCRVPRAGVIRRYGGYAAMQLCTMHLCTMQVYLLCSLCAYAPMQLRARGATRSPSPSLAFIPALTHPIPDYSIFRHSLPSCPPVRSARASHLAVFSPDTSPRITSRLPSAPSLIAHPLLLTLSSVAAISVFRPISARENH